MFVFDFIIGNRNGSGILDRSNIDTARTEMEVDVASSECKL